MAEITKADSRIRVFKWNAKIPAEEGLPESKTRAVLFLIRLYTTFTGTTPQPPDNKTYRRDKQAGTVSFSKDDLSRFNSRSFKCSLLSATLKDKPILDLCNNVESLAFDLAAEIDCKFRFSPETLSGQGPKLVIFLDLDLAIDGFDASPNSDDYSRGKYNELDEFIDLKGDISVQQIEDILNTLYDISINVGSEEITGFGEVKANLKVKVFERSDDSEEQLCPVCLENLVEGSIVAETSCSHTFHKGCVFRWLLDSISCPICRSTCVACV